MALVTDYTATDYNSYCTIVDMDAIMAELGVLMETDFWNTLDDAVKENLIIASVREINSLEWIGEQNPAIVVLTMLFPRSEIPNVADDEIPHEILLRMGCWITYNAVANGNGSGSNKKAGMIASKKVGDVDITYETKSDIIKALGSVVDSNPCSQYASDLLVKDTIGGIGGIGLKRRA